MNAFKIGDGIIPIQYYGILISTRSNYENYRTGFERILISGNYRD